MKFRILYESSDVIGQSQIYPPPSMRRCCKQIFFEYNRYENAYACVIKKLTKRSTIYYQWMFYSTYSVNFLYRIVVVHGTILMNAEDSEQNYRLI